ncbi:MAG: RrF2 family transcriptional regulator [Chloroflexi bacterium]|nr:RrF2 family transcriptional regulator [Chloroflexota bacterium]
MRFSTRSHYGLRVMVDLAAKHGQGPLPLTDIARAESLSLGYLEHLMAQLRAAGLVEGTKGVRGGYRLMASPASVTVGSVLRALEGPVAPIDCVSETGGEKPCSRERSCPSQAVWRRVRDSLVQVLDSMTLADIIKPGEGIQESPVILSQASAARIVEESFGAGRETKDPSPALRFAQGSGSG